ncbi:hypothetical protein SVAN01_09221 [Stagonosporopsis vannaccii]|nr:hypothetical protein SVAN01_09221 [Stagonosporopsis vannaccii]
MIKGRLLCSERRKRDMAYGRATITVVTSATISHGFLSIR